MVWILILSILPYWLSHFFSGVPVSDTRVASDGHCVFMVHLARGRKNGFGDDPGADIRISF